MLLEFESWIHLARVGAVEVFPPVHSCGLKCVRFLLLLLIFTIFARLKIFSCLNWDAGFVYLFSMESYFQFVFGRFGETRMSTAKNSWVNTHFLYTLQYKCKVLVQKGSTIHLRLLISQCFIHKWHSLLTLMARGGISRPDASAE